MNTRTRNAKTARPAFHASLVAGAILVVSLSGHAQPVGSRSKVKTVPVLKAVRTLTGCLACHGMPDPRVPGDSLWISRISTTGCVAPPAPESDGLRNALKRYVTKRDTLRPTLVDASTPKAGAVPVVSNIVRGSVLLEPFDPAREARGRGRSRIPPTIDRSPRAQPLSFRIAWDGAEKRERSIPPGRYRIRLYRLLKEDANGKLWQVWGSGDEGQRLTAEAGTPLRIDVTHRVKIVPCAAKRVDPLNLAGMAHGDNGMGITIMDGDVRSRARYRLIDAQGDEVANGALEYG